MLPFITVFGILVGILAVIGAMRGWAKELINTFGIVLALFLYDLLINNTDIVKSFLFQLSVSDPEGGPRLSFLLMSALFLTIVFFAYLGPVAARWSGGRLNVKARETVQDALLGLFLGLFNGYLVVGTVWFFLEITNYPFPESMMLRPAGGSYSAQFVNYLPLVWITPYLKFLLPISMLLVIIMFV